MTQENHSTENEENIGTALADSFRYWAGRRLLFNSIVGIAGVISVITLIGSFITLFDLFGMAIWGVVANIFYSTGYIIESYVIARSKGESNLAGSRDFLFWTGTIAYVVVGYFFVLMYSFPVPD